MYLIFSSFLSDSLGDKERVYAPRLAIRGFPPKRSDGSCLLDKARETLLKDMLPPADKVKQEGHQVTKVFGWQVNNSFLCGIWHLSINPILCLCHLIYYGFNLSVLSLSLRD